MALAFLFMAQILSHSCTVTFLEAPWSRMKALRADTCSPRRNTPCSGGTKYVLQRKLHRYILVVSSGFSLIIRSSFTSKASLLFVPLCELSALQQGAYMHCSEGAVPGQWAFWDLAIHPLGLFAQTRSTCAWIALC